MSADQSLEQVTIEKLIEPYALGQLLAIANLTAGTVQSNIRLRTTQGNFVLRYYRQNRSFEAVCFEVELIDYLINHRYPCAAVIRDQAGQTVGMYNERPFVLFAFIEGEHIGQPTAAQQRQLIAQVAELQRLTAGFQPTHVDARWNYDIPFCEQLAAETAAQLATPQAAAKLTWYRQILAQLQLPPTHPKGICHCDFHFSNVLFHAGEFRALLDFDDANYTYLTFDLVALLEPVLFQFRWDNWQTVRPGGDVFAFTAAQEIIADYERVRPMQTVEKEHLFDVLKLAILIDCLWFFARGEAGEFYERRKIECLDAMGRESFSDALFGSHVFDRR